MLPLRGQQASHTTDWTTYNGSLTGNRYSSLSQINTTNVATLKLIRSLPVPSPTGLETTPVVHLGVMYVASANSVYAYGLTSGKQLWSFVRPQTTGVVQDASSGINRGAAIAPGKSGSPPTIFYVTDNAHLLALNGATGALLWESVVADYSQNYSSTGAPLYLPDLNLVVAGISGGDSGVRGLLAAYNATTGALAWQFYTTPASITDPLAASWGDGSILPHGGGATWMTGTYDTATKVLYWGVGNVCPDLNGDNRQGDNLYTSSVVALNAANGSLQWYFQYTPHGLWDFDGANTPVLVDTTWKGKRRHLMLHANRNGYFYVLDRGTGKYLSGFPFVTNLNWSTGLDAKGRPMVNPAATPTPAGVVVCPSGGGAANWSSVAYSSITSLFYVQASEACSTRTSVSPAPPWQAGTEYNAGVNGIAQVNERHVRAINPVTGAIAWDYPEQGYHFSYGGLLATAGGLVFVAEDSTAFTALDASTGAMRWTYQPPPGASNKSSPMTYEFNGNQYIALSFTTNILIFGLPAKAPAVQQVCPATSGKLGVAYSSSPQVSGGTPPYTFSIASGALPSGLTLDSTTGMITGTPATGGVTAYSLVASDSVGQQALSECGITVSPMPLKQLCSAGSAAVGVPFISALSGKGGVLPYTYSKASGSLPPGMTLSSLGAISGTPTATGTFVFTGQLTDSSGTAAGTVTNQCGITVRTIPVVSCPASTGSVGTAYSSPVTATGGKPPYNLFSIVSGALPDGLALDNTMGTITGTPSAPGAYSFTLSVADSTGSSAGIGTAACQIVTQ